MALTDISQKQAKLITVLEAARDQVKKYKEAISRYDQNTFNHNAVMKGLYDTKTVIVMSLAENDALIEDINSFMTKEDNILSELSMTARFLAADSQVLKEGLLATNDLADTSLIELKSLLARVKPDLLDNMLEMDKQVLHYLPTRSSPDLTSSRERQSVRATTDSSCNEEPRSLSGRDEISTSGSTAPISSDLSAKAAYNKLVYSQIPVIERYFTAAEVNKKSDVSLSAKDNLTLSLNIQENTLQSDQPLISDPAQKSVSTKLERRKARVTAAIAATDAIRKNRQRLITSSKPAHPRPDSTKAKVKIGLPPSQAQNPSAVDENEDSDYIEATTKRAMYRQLMRPSSAKRPDIDTSLPPHSLELSLSLRQIDKPKMALPKRPLSSVCARTQRLSRRDYTTRREDDGWPKASDKYDLAQIIQPPRDIYGHKKLMKINTRKRYKYQEEACIPFKEISPTYTDALHAGTRYDRDPTLVHSTQNKSASHAVWRNKDDIVHEIAENIHYTGLHSKENYRHSDLNTNSFHNNLSTSATRRGRKALTPDHYSDGSNQHKTIWDHSTKDYESRMDIAERVHIKHQRSTNAPRTSQAQQYTIEEPGLYSIKKTVYSLKNQLNDAKAEIRRLKSQVASQNNVVASFGSAVTGVAQGIMRDNVRVASLVRANNEHMKRESNLINAKINAIKLKADRSRSSSVDARSDPRIHQKRETNACSDNYDDDDRGDHHLVDLLAPYKCSDGIMSAKRPVVVLGHILDSEEEVMLRRSADAIDILPSMSTALDNLQLSNSGQQQVAALSSIIPPPRSKVTPAHDFASMMASHRVANETCKRIAGLPGICDCARCSQNQNKGFLQGMDMFYDPQPPNISKRTPDSIAFAQKVLTEDMTNGYNHRRFVTATIKNIADRPIYN